MNRFKVNLKQVLIGALVVVVILLMADFNNRMSELHRLTTQRDRAAAQSTSLMQTQTTLQTRIAYATSAASVEEWAYEEGRLVRPGDNPIAPLPEGEGVPTPTPTPESNPEKVNNWEIWLALFFDREP